jgi:prepilin-type N-terminal cleavage/methylation domain-containing protein
MASLKKRNNLGFTIVELLIVIIVIGILAALVLVTYNGVQQKARDTERKTDIQALASHLEVYNAQNGRYATLANMNDATFRAANMKGLDSNALQDPKGAAQTLCSTVQANCYAYVTTPANCDNGANGDCTNYVLTATLEAGGTFVKQSSN